MSIQNRVKTDDELITIAAAFGFLIGMAAALVFAFDAGQAVAAQKIAALLGVSVGCTGFAGTAHGRSIALPTRVVFALMTALIGIEAGRLLVDFTSWG